MKLSVLMPAYNEASTVSEIVDRVRAVAFPAGVELEMIAVDDGSSDATLAQLRAAEERTPELTVVAHDANRGKGAAIRTAIGHSTGDIVVIQDADLEYDPSELPRLIDPILDGRADAVYGSRFSASSSRRVIYFWHSLGNRILTTLSNMCTNLNLTDMETCYKAVRGDVLRSIPIRSDRFGIEPELTAKLAKRRCRIYEISISYDGRTYDEGKKITWRDGVKALITILTYRLIDDTYDDKHGHAVLHQLSTTRRFNRWMADSIEPWVGDEVLEIGAGLGNMSSQLLPRSYYTVADIDPLHLQSLAARFDGHHRVDVAKIDLGRPADFEPFREAFDSVVCLNVVEHVADDEQALANLYSALVPGGRACVLVPRGQGLFGTLDEMLDHHRRYGREELRDKCVRVGFEVEHLFSFNRATVPGWWLNGKVLKRREFGGAQLRIFDSMVWLIRRIDFLLPWDGVSLIVIAKRPEQGLRAVADQHSA